VHLRDSFSAPERDSQIEPFLELALRRSLKVDVACPVRRNENRGQFCRAGEFGSRFVHNFGASTISVFVRFCAEIRQPKRRNLKTKKPHFPEGKRGFPQF
jgi:hypothetical protein